MPPKNVSLKSIKAGGGGAFDSQDASGTGLSKGGNKNLGDFRQNSVMGTKSQDRIVAAEYRAQIEAVGKDGLSALDTEEDPSAKQQKRNPFWQHQASFSNFESIQDPRERYKIAWALGKLDEFAAAHESLLGQGSQMSHSEMISDMLFDEEELVPVPPLLCTSFKKVIVETGGTKEFRFGVKVYLTNRRIIMMDAEVTRMPTLEDSLDSQDKSLFLRERHKIQVEVGDRSWYYPIPLNLLKGVTLDIHYSTKAHGFLSQRRPIYHIAFLIICGVAILNYTLAEMMARNDDYTQHLAELEGRFDAADALVSEGGKLEDEDAVFWAQLFTGLFMCGITPLLYFYFKDYSRSRFIPKMQQSRQITFGIFDPLYQKQAIFYLDLDDRYSPMRIRNYLYLHKQSTVACELSRSFLTCFVIRNRIQAFAPHIAGRVLNA